MKPLNMSNTSNGPFAMRPCAAVVSVLLALAGSVAQAQERRPAASPLDSFSSSPTSTPAVRIASLDLAPSRRLGAPSMGRSNYVAQLRESLLRMAREQPEVLSARAAADTSQFAVESARQARYPRLKVGTATGTYDSGVAGAGSQSYRQITADLRMSLLDGGVMSARVEAAEAGSGAQSEAVKSVSQKVVLDALTTYLQVQRFDLKAMIAQRSTALLDELARAEQRRVELGATGQNDLRMASARRAGTAARELEFAALRNDAMAKFERYFRLKANPALLPSLTVPAAWQPTSQEEALRIAEAGSSELAESQGRLAQARKLTDLQAASIYPTVDAVLVKTKDPRGSAVSEPTRAAFELTWNFGNGFDQQLRMKSALAEVANQEALLEGVKANLMELTSASWSRTVAGRERERQLRQAVEESAQAYSGRRRLLDLGRETLLHVLDAQIDHYTLLLDYVDAVFDQQVTEFRLARATAHLRVEPDSDNAWVQRLFDGPARPVLDEQGLLRTPGHGVAAAGGGPGNAMPSGAGLRRAVRLGPL